MSSYKHITEIPWFIPSPNQPFRQAGPGKWPITTIPVLPGTNSATSPCSEYPTPSYEWISLNREGPNARLVFQPNTSSPGGFNYKRYPDVGLDGIYLSAWKQKAGNNFGNITWLWKCTMKNRNMQNIKIFLQLFEILGFWDFQYCISNVIYISLLLLPRIID